MDDSSAVTTSSDKPWLFRSGNSEYRAKKQRIAERLAKLRLDYDPSPSQQMLLVVIAGHLDDAERCRSAIARTRATNAARRLLRDIPRKAPLASHPAQALETARAMLDRLGKGDPSAV
jgi:hypothetical protein